MREIKFRAKRIDTGTWKYGNYFTTPLTDENSGTAPDTGWFFLVGEPRHCIGQDGVAFVIDEKTVGQFTGLRDKNRVEIYEGDILRARTEGPEWVGSVYWKGATYWIGNRPTLNPDIMDGCYLGVVPDCEVIGNIHENPELLS